MDTIHKILLGLETCTLYYRELEKQSAKEKVAKEAAEIARICRSYTTFEFCFQFTQASGRKVEYFQVEGYNEAMNLFETYRKIGHAMKLRVMTVSTVSETEEGKEYTANKTQFNYNDKAQNL